jgi:branched-chain amino acid aminotransferase
MEVESEKKKHSNNRPASRKGGFFHGRKTTKKMGNYYNAETVIWRDGALVKAAEATTDLYSQSMHYGYAVFEGIRSYRTASGETRIFKPVEHYLRLEASAKALNMHYPWAVEELIDATYAVLNANGQQDAYIRPLVFHGANMSFNRNDGSYIVIEAWTMDPFLGDKLLRIKLSSFQRPNPKAFHIHAKASGHYVNSILASQEAKAAGYDEALLTDMNGFVAEGPGANVFLQKDGKLITPAPGNILTGITRATVLELAAAYGIPVEERRVTIDELREADSAFFCGTAAEVIGWSSFDDQEFPLAWKESLGHVIQQAYKARVKESPIPTWKQDAIIA